MRRGWKQTSLMKVMKTKGGKAVGKKSIIMNEENVCWATWNFSDETHKTIILYPRVAVSDQPSTGFKV